jgi:septal ring factor EnvC (AmiA/AmiB activator)
MGKALNWLVIVLLLLSIVALSLGITLFTQRETLKGRTLKHEDAVAKIATNLRADPVNVESLKSLSTMQASLDLVAVAADNQYELLQNTKKDLENTKQELAATKSELEATKGELAAAQTKVGELTQSLEQKDAELAVASGKITQLEQDKAALQVQVEDLNNQLVKAEDEMKDVQDKVNMLEAALAKAESDQGGKKLLPAGLTGKILVVDPEWNFVVLDIGSEAGLVANAEMLIHRGEELVGKVRISTVEKNMAVAEIVNDWSVAEPREGDYVLF